jgi:hypothetical protein
MLPGFRFLFGAIVLCFSMMVFGLGAAALFRAAHEEFASRPSWRATPGTMLAQQNEPFAQRSDSSITVLALLEVEPDDKAAASETPHDSAREPGLQPSASEATAAVPEPAAGNLVDPPKPVALSAPEEPSPVAASETVKETAKDAPTTPQSETMAHLEPGMAPGEESAEVEHAAPPAGASAPAPPIASLNETASTTVEPSTPASEPINIPAVQPETVVPAPKIAALGSPETTDTQAREKEASNEIRAKAYRNFIKKRLRAQRAAKARRRLAQHRARTVRRAAVQQPPPAARAAFQPQPPAAFTTVPATTFIPAAENPYRF